MKKGYKHKTGVFGTDAERYVASLLGLMQNRQGDRRPDLVSVNGRYKPRLSIEVKSGRKQKGVMVDYQLHYAITTQEDYRDVIGEEVPQVTGLLPEIDWSTSAAPFLPKTTVAYHYWLINRVDELTAQDLDRPFAAIQLRWGDVYSAPHRYAFAGFAAAKANRTKRGSVVTGKELEAIVADMKETIKWDVVHRGSDYESRKGDPQSWQDLHGRDFLALFHGDNSLTTQDGQERIRIIGELYPEVKTASRISIPGPNNTTIYVLAEPGEEDLFDLQVRRAIEKRKPLIETITRSRARAAKRLSGLRTPGQQGLLESGFSGNTPPQQNLAPFNLTPQRARYLNRLVHWLGRRETETAQDDPDHSSDSQEPSDGDGSFEFGANAPPDTEIPF